MGHAHMSHRVFVFFLVIGMAQTVLSQTTGSWAPAGHIQFYANAHSDIAMIDVRVPGSPTDKTYYETLGWNQGAEGGGYTGIQWDVDSKGGGPIWIFSIWDSIAQPTAPITATYAQPGSNVARFSGEGTGLHYDNTALGWKPDQWVRSVVRSWDDNGKNYWGMWSYDHSAGLWTHHVTFQFPLVGTDINAGGVQSFLEDWAGTGANVRSMDLRDGWRRSGGTWQALDQGTYFPWQPDGPYRDAFDANADNGHYTMQSGGGTKPSFVGTTRLLQVPSTQNKPTLTTGAVVAASARQDMTQRRVDVSWVIDPTSSPQFRYQVTLLQDDVILASTQATEAHTRAVQFLNIATPCVACEVQIAITDLFDQPAPTFTAPVAPTDATPGADCLFSWAQRSYPALFAPPTKASMSAAPFYFRYYSETGSFLATSGTDHHVWVLSPSLGTQPLDLGPLTWFSAMSGCSASSLLLWDLGLWDQSPWN